MAAREIVVFIEGGVIQHVSGGAPGDRLVIVDYDTEGTTGPNDCPHEYPTLTTVEQDDGARVAAFVYDMDVSPEDSMTHRARQALARLSAKQNAELEGL